VVWIFIFRCDYSRLEQQAMNCSLPYDAWSIWTINFSSFLQGILNAFRHYTYFHPGWNGCGSVVFKVTTLEFEIHLLFLYIITVVLITWSSSTVCYISVDDIAPCLWDFGVMVKS